VYLIALTGGIASGKSTVARRLVELGAVLVDADALAREVVEPGMPALAAIEQRFGPSVLTPDGRLDRAALGAIVFADERSRLDLNAITHPAVWGLAKQRFADAEQRDPNAVVVYDVPLLVEASGDRPMRFDRVLVVQADRDERVRRLVELRGMSRPEAERRIDAQAGDAERLAVADDVIDANGAIEQTMRRTDDVWHALQRPDPDA
jgi:dephospho-CoA kinase